MDPKFIRVLFGPAKFFLLLENRDTLLLENGAKLSREYE